MIKKVLSIFISVFFFSCSGNSDKKTVYEGYAFSNKNILYITIDSDKNISYSVLEGGNKGKSGHAKLKKLDTNKKIYEYKDGNVVYRAVLFSHDYKNNRKDHLIVVFIKDENFPEGEFAIGMTEPLKERPVPQIITWADGDFYNIKLDEYRGLSKYRLFKIKNLAREWESKSAETIPDLFEENLRGNLSQKKGNPYTFEYLFKGTVENEEGGTIHVLNDSETVIIKYPESLGSGIEIGTRNKNKSIDDFEEGRRLWILCSDGSWAQGEIDDFHPTPDEADTVDKPKIDFVFNTGKKETIYVTFDSALCAIKVRGSYACDFLTPYILDPKVQLIVLDNYKYDEGENPVDCIGGW